MKLVPARQCQAMFQGWAASKPTPVHSSPLQRCPTRAVSGAAAVLARRSMFRSPRRLAICQAAVAARDWQLALGRKVSREAQQRADSMNRRGEYRDGRAPGDIVASGDGRRTKGNPGLEK
ncbi:hypothetical protein CC78DRAFT_531858 [Lojkania enalia]|uniref:Uncharacterized protein n=1 Tax=Lojkania enalia TaxID=147567 RepID=A0A9P4KCK4_9PLEO|nr:hypothetical protein CC78DRAFT_531858 [Didymosphaeria enalia]